MFGSILMGRSELGVYITSALQYDRQPWVLCCCSDTPMESQSREIRCCGAYS